MLQKRKKKKIFRSGTIEAQVKYVDLEIQV